MGSSSCERGVNLISIAIDPGYHRRPLGGTESYRHARPGSSPTSQSAPTNFSAAPSFFLRPLVTALLAMRKLDPAIRKIWTIKYALFTTVAVLGSAVYELPRLFTGREGAWPLGLSTLTLLVVGLAVTLLVPKLRYKFWAFALDTDELLLERGVWKRVYTVVPLRRIQHLDVSRNLLEREFDLGRLIVYTAGTQGNRVVLPGLRYDEAERLRDTLKHYILDDAL